MPVSVIQILDDADAAFRILGAGLRTVLSVTTMFADKPHRLNGRTSRAAILCFDDLASGYRTRGWATRAAGYRAAISCIGTSRHFGEVRNLVAIGVSGLWRAVRPADLWVQALGKLRRASISLCAI